MFNAILFCYIVSLCTVSGLADQNAPQIDQAFADLCGSSGCGTRTSGIKSTKLQFRLEGAGFHGILHYSAEVTFGGWSKPGQPCEIILVEPLPAIIYANIYELDNAYAAERGPKVQLFGTVDVESIEKFAAPTVLAVFATLKFSNSQSSTAAVNVSLPLHGRYPRPRVPKLDNSGVFGWRYLIAQDFENVELASPDVLLRCQSDKDAGKGQGWRRIDKVESEKIPIWSLPAGNLLLAKFTAVITAIVVSASAVIVLKSIFGASCYRNIDNSDRKIL